MLRKASSTIFNNKTSVIKQNKLFPKLAFTTRLQRVKMGTAPGDWLRLNKSTPQGSVMGPFAYICIMCIRMT